jgi:hypothetical protein
LSASTRILFDQGTPAPLRKHLGNHSVETAYERGWSQLENGELLSTAQAPGFDLFLTTIKIFGANGTSQADKFLSLCCRPPSGLSSTNSAEIAAAVNSTKPRDFRELTW